MAKHLMRPLGRESHPDGAETYAPDILAAWLRAFPNSKAKDRDKEDWVENACFIESLERLGLDYALLDAHEGNVWISSTADTLPSGNGPAAFFHTGIGGKDHLEGVSYALPLQTPKAIRAVTEYATDEVFLARAGRPMLLARPTSSALNDAVRQIVPEGGQVFIKTVKKGATYRFDIEAGRDPWEQMAEQNENFIWSYMQYEGMDVPFFNVQGLIEPTYEYRMFMVGDRPVTGAGCVEAFTPLDNWDVFDPKMEPVRNKTGVITAHDVLDSYRDFADEFGRAFAERHGKALTYSLDLCLDRNTGKVIPIELNPPMNLGRYASDVDAWILAVDMLMSQ